MCCGCTPLPERRCALAGLFIGLILALVFAVALGGLGNMILSYALCIAVAIASIYSCIRLAIDGAGRVLRRLADDDARREWLPREEQPLKECAGARLQHAHLEADDSEARAEDFDEEPVALEVVED